jgi:hypothetical protein
MMNRRLLVVLMLVAVAAMVGQPAWSQATISTGSIQGTVTDPQGAAVVNAEVTISSQNGGKSIEVVTNGSGLYNSGGLQPGIYAVRVSAQGFQTIALSITVQVGSISAGNIALTLGSQATVVEVTSGAVLVNTEQAQIQGVVNAEQIDNLPINGRNFLDLAQLEPGVQIQDGGDFDPTKTGFSSISFGGRFGRTARIEVDGVDVSDENVGTTTQSIPASAISEFQLAQSSLDLSNELTSSGAVNVVTKSGTNSFHGEGYGLFRTSTQGAVLPGNGTYQRNQEGGNVGGPILKDKLFFFADGERTLQHAGAGVLPADPFNSFAGTFPSPFKEGDLLGRVDFQATKSLHIFYRFDYFSNYLVPPFGAPSFSFFANKDITRTDVAGGDWTTGPWTHSIRFEYLRFQNQITDAVRGSGEPFSDFPVSTFFTSSGLATGPSDNAPQATPQSDHEIKYDGSRIFGSHILRYGVAYNHLQGGGFASFFAFAPLAINAQISPTATSPYNSFVPTANLVCPGGQTGMSCPLNYVADELLIGNGQGFSTPNPAFGLPFGGIGPDNRFAFYVGDSWKIKSNLTLTYGTRYVRDTGRTDSNLPPIPSLNLLLPGLGNQVHQPNANFGPQIGLAWDPFKTGKTVIRAGAGIYYENSVWNNVLFDQPPRLQTGTFFFADATPCFFGGAGPVQFGDGSVQTIPGGNALCTAALGATIPNAAVGATCPAGIIVAQCMVNFQTAYAASYAAHPLNPNPNYIGTQIANGLPISAVFNPNYVSPRSVQMNVGFQRELSKGTVLSVDYIRNIGTHFLLGIDENHTGDAAFFNPAAGAQAIATTLTNCGVATINQSIVNCPTDPLGPLDAAENGYTPRAATIADYASNGLDGPKDLNVGVCQNPKNGIASGNQCAFAGINPNIGPTSFLTPVGRSLYNAMDVKLTQNVRNPAPYIKYLNLQASYALSRFKYCGSQNGLQSPGTPGNQDQDFIDTTLDNDNPCRYFGSTLLDRTNQLNFGGWADLPAGFRLGIVGHVWSPLAITPTMNATAGPGAIFQDNFTGDGTVSGEPMPLAQTSATCGTVGGTCDYTMVRSGAFGRGLNPASLATAINNYNANIANTEPTPAGQAVISAGLMTLTQLQELGGVPQPIASVVPGQVGPSWLKTVDTQISWDKKIGERFTITPSVGFFNVFNFRNWDAAGNTLSGSLSGQAGSINGTFGNGVNGNGNRTNAIGTGTGVFSLGAGRAIEWGLRFQF